MAKKQARNTMRKAPSRARQTFQTARRGARRAGRRQVTVTVQDIALGIAGAVLVNKVEEHLPIDDPKNRSLALTALAGFGAMKSKGMLKPLLIGAAIGSGVRTVSLWLPDFGLTSNAKSTSKTLSTLTDKKRTITGHQANITDLAREVRTIGQRTASEEDSIRRAVQYSIAERGTIAGSINGSINGTINGRKRGSIFQ